MKVDLLIAGGAVIDGTGADRTTADVAVTDGRIVAVAPNLVCDAQRRLSAAGLVVAPGLIDCHTHDDTVVCLPEVVQAKLLQGVTTVVAGNCGLSAAPMMVSDPPPPLDILRIADGRHESFGSFLRHVEEQGPLVNAAFLVGHTSLRVSFVRELDRPAQADEIALMRAALEEALAAGAAGASIGLFYPPARAATAEEVIAVLEPMRGSGLPLTAHLRDEGHRVLPAMQEAFDIARALDVPLVISHHKLWGERNHGRSRETLSLIEGHAGRSRGRAALSPVCMDCYPYEAASTMLSPETAADAGRVRITWSSSLPQHAGRDLDEVAREMEVSRSAAIERLMPAGGTFFAMHEDDVRAILTHPLAMVASDGLPHDRHPHPRLWGTFPRVLGPLVRDRGWLSLEQAVHKMTGFPAERFGLHGRGRVAVGFAADLVLFDAGRISDQATYATPSQPPVGISAVLVNGLIAVRAGEVADARAGHVLRTPVAAVAAPLVSRGRNRSRSPSGHT
jgi:N-acyl-D-amino-acid deacylase